MTFSYILRHKILEITFEERFIFKENHGTIVSNGKFFLGVLLSPPLYREYSQRAALPSLGCPRLLTFLMFSQKLKTRKSTFRQFRVRENKFKFEEPKKLSKSGFLIS